MSTPIWIGTDLAGYLLEDVPATIDIDESGVAKGSLTFTSRYDGAVGLVLAVTEHPTYPWLQRTTATVTREEGDSAKIVVNYEGVTPSPGDEEVPAERKQYSLKVTAGNEPIETHPQFFAMITNFRAIIDKEDDKFKGFPAYLDAEKTQRNPMAGVKNYLVPGLIYEESYTDPDGNVDLGALFGTMGAISVPPSSGVLPNIPGRNWLMVGGSVSKVGDGLKVTRSWRMSGDDGWNPSIYL
jgi:hypothetical protein